MQTQELRAFFSQVYIVFVIHSIYDPTRIKQNFYQYSETNMMHFLFSLLRIKGLYMFRALLAHLQEALHKRHLVYCMRVMSVGCTRIGVKVMLETCTGP
jgi:hypothetical protein